MFLHVERLKDTVPESPLSPSLGDIDSNEVPSASCNGQDTDDISLHHSLLHGKHEHWPLKALINNEDVIELHIRSVN